VLADINANAKRGKKPAPISPMALEAVKRIDGLFDIDKIEFPGGQVFVLKVNDDDGVLVHDDFLGKGDKLNSSERASDETGVGPTERSQSLRWEACLSQSGFDLLLRCSCLDIDDSLGRISGHLGIDINRLDRLRHTAGAAPAGHVVDVELHGNLLKKNVPAA